MTDTQLDIALFVDDEPVLTRREQLDFMLGDFIQAADFTGDDRETVARIMTDLQARHPGTARMMLERMEQALRQWKDLCEEVAVAMRA